MISYVKGKVIEKRPDGLVVIVGGLGLDVHAPAGTLDKAPQVGQDVALFTYLHVRQDLMQLYGFDTAAARDLFVRLMSVSSIGPRLALSVLSVFSPEGFIRVINEGDADALTIIPGVGKKSSQRLILELREKVEQPLEDMVGVAPEARRTFEEAMEALMQLGFSRQESFRALKGYSPDEGEPRVEDMIQFALKSFGPGREQGR